MASGIYTRDFLIQASNQRGTCLAERPARGWPVSVIRGLCYNTWHRRQDSDSYNIVVATTITGKVLTFKDTMNCFSSKSSLLSALLALSCSMISCRLLARLCRGSDKHTKINQYFSRDVCSTRFLSRNRDIGCTARFLAVVAIEKGCPTLTSV